MAYPIVVTFLTVCILAHATIGNAALDYSNPFVPEQCDLAYQHAEHLLRDRPEDARAQSLRAEALLCRGLQNDREALDAAITAFREILVRAPNSFFAQMYLSEALRARYTLSAEARAAFVRAQRLLVDADVAAARMGLQSHISEAIRDLDRQAQAYSSLIRDGEVALAAGTASPQQVAELAMVLAQTGPHGVERAIAVLDTFLASHFDVVLDTFYRAEILRGHITTSSLAILYQSAHERLCRSYTAVDRRMVEACDVIQRRLRRLDETSGCDASRPEGSDGLTHSIEQKGGIHE